MQSSCFSRIHPSILPGVPITTWSTIFSLLLAPTHLASAVYAMVILAYLPIFSMTMTFWMASSRVGHMHSACGAGLDTSTRDSIPSVKQVVLPDPLCACAMRLRCGGWRIIGRVSPWIFDGRSNFISLYRPCSSSALRPSSSKDLAEA